MTPHLWSDVKPKPIWLQTFMHWFQVFVAMNLTTYGMNVDMLDVHAVSRYLVTSLSADDDEDDMSFQITQKSYH